MTATPFAPATGWQGPAVVAGEDSTIVIPPGWDASCDSFGNILIARAGGAA